MLLIVGVLLAPSALTCAIGLGVKRLTGKPRLVIFGMLLLYLLSGFVIPAVVAATVAHQLSDYSGLIWVLAGIVWIRALEIFVLRVGSIFVTAWRAGA